MTWAARFWRAATRSQVERAAPLLRDLHLASREAYVRLAGDEDFGLVQRGLLMLCQTPHTLDDEGRTAAQANALGVPAEVLDARQTAARDPGVTMEIAGSIYFPKDCHLDPAGYIALLEKRLRAAGAELLYGADVTGWHKEGNRLATVRTSSGEVAGDEFVLAGGAWSPDLVRELGLRIPMQAGKGYSVTVQQPVELPRLCSILTEARVAVTPMGGALRFGGTMEISGFNETISARRVTGIIKAALRYFPQFRAEHFAAVQPWCGLPMAFRISGAPAPPRTLSSRLATR